MYRRPEDRQPLAGLASSTMHNLVLVCLGLTSVFIAQTMLMLAVPLRALELGASPIGVGLLLSAPYLLPLVFAIPLGCRATIKVRVTRQSR